jgi:hypothetical protein
VKSESLEERIANHLRPPEQPHFLEELWERAERAAARSARRWRLTAIATTAVALTAVSAAAIYAFDGAWFTARIVDKTITCSVPDQGGVNLVRVGAGPRGNAQYPVPAALAVSAGYSGNPLWYVLLSEARKGYTLDHSLCKPRSRVPLAADGLPALTAQRGILRECWIAPQMALRLHVKFGSKGKPVAAQLAIRSGKRLRPVAYVSWTPKRVRAFVSKNFCHTA